MANAGVLGNVPPMRVRSGFTDANRTEALGFMPRYDPSRLFYAWIDFTGLDYVTAQWTVTETQAGATQSLVASDATGEFGLLALVNTAGAADVNSIQLTTAGIFLGNTGKRWWMKGRLSRDNADESMGLGVQAVNATPFTVSSGLFMHILGASTDATFTIGKAAALTTATGTAAYATSALNTFVDLGMAYDGYSKIDCFVNNARVARITTLTNLPNTVVLTPTVSGANTTANARTVHADYLMFAVER